MRLTREVRFSLLPAQTSAAAGAINSWAGWPTAVRVAPYLVLRMTVEGRVDPRSGYLVNIKLIDRLLRERAIPVMQRCFGPGVERTTPAEKALGGTWTAVRDRAPAGTRAAALELWTTPFLRYAVTAEAGTQVSVTQSFEFAASHRLFNPQLSEEENRALFGKCANEHGHGHNYRVEVTLTGEPDPYSGQLIALADFEATVMRQVIERFDHKHLNLDCPEFAATIPSVENIARVIWNLLDGRFGRARLSCVRVWETPKTFAECSTRE